MTKTDVAVSFCLPRDLDARFGVPPDTRRARMRLAAGCAEKLGEEELRAMRARQAVLENFTSMYQP